MIKMDDSKFMKLKDIQPFWKKSEAPLQTGGFLLQTGGFLSVAQPDEMPHFLTRTETAYVKLPLNKTLNDRGISNRLFDSFIEYLPEGAIIAGGFMTSLMQEDKHAQDVDFFFTSNEGFEKTCEMFLSPPVDEEAWAYQGYKLAEDFDIESFNKSKGHITRFLKFVHPTRLPVQLVKLVWYDSPEHVIDSFDFTIAQFAADCNHLYTNPLSVFDLARKRLVLHRIQFPASTLRRLIKYTSKGYYCCPGSLETIARASADIIQKHEPDVLNGYVYLD